MYAVSTQIIDAQLSECNIGIIVGRRGRDFSIKGKKLNMQKLADKMMSIFQRTPTVMLWFWMVVFSLVMTEILASGMEWLLLGKVTADYLVTGMVVSIVVASVVVASIIYFGKGRRFSDGWRLGNSTDITERRQIDIGLLQSERKLRYLCKSVNDCIEIISMDGRILDINPAGYIKLDYTLEEMQGKFLSEFELPEYSARMAERMALIKGQGYAIFESARRHKDGTVIPVEVNARLIELDGQMVFLGIVRDITERKLMMAELHRARQIIEYKLQESEARFASTFEQAAVGLAHVGLDGRWLYVNENICQIVGYSREELMQKTFQEITHPDDLETDLEYVRQMLSDEIDRYTMEKRYIHKNGTEIWIRLTVSLHRKPDGTPDYFIAVIEDIADAKEVDAKLKELREQADRLTTQQVVTQTIMALAHDLNQPLNAAGSYSAAALQLIKPEEIDRPRLMEVIKFNVTEIRRAGDVLRTLIQSVNRNNESDELLDLIEVIHEAIRSFNDEVYEATPAFVVESSHTKLDVTVKSLLLRKALMNLFRNAHQAMGARDFERRARKITVRVVIDLDRVVVTISDNGTGIREEVVKDLFKPFFTTKADGIGMGLAISRALIESCGGELWYKPIGGRTAFHFSLPTTPNAGFITTGSLHETDCLHR